LKKMGDDTGWWYRSGALFLWAVLSVHLSLLVLACIGDVRRSRAGHSPGVLVCQKQGLEDDDSDIKDILLQGLYSLYIVLLSLWQVILCNPRLAATRVISHASKLVGSSISNIHASELGKIRKLSASNLKKVNKTLVAVSSKNDSLCSLSLVTQKAAKKQVDMDSLRVDEDQDHEHSRVRHLHTEGIMCERAVDEAATKLLSVHTGFVTRVLHLLHAIHPWSRALLTSHFAPASLLTSLRFGLDMGGLAVSALFFENAGGANAEGGPSECDPSDGMEALIMTITVGLVSSLLSGVPIAILTILALGGRVVDHEHAHRGCA